MRGFFVLLTCLATLVLLPTLVSRWLAPAPAAPAATDDDIRALDHLAARLEQAEYTRRRERYAANAPMRTSGEAENDHRSYSAADRRRHHRRQPDAPVELLRRLTPFDPNALTATDWQRRGVPADVARRLVSYGRKAGGFRYREQLERIHGLDAAVLARLTPFMRLPTRAEAFARPQRPAEATSAGRPVGAGAAPNGASAGATAPSAVYFRKPRVVRAFDLNTADTLALMQLRGIGQRRAARIVELREKLGGFVSEGQLSEVWGLDGALVDSIARYGHITPTFRPRPLPINSASVEELQAHPYVGPRLARVIVAFREQHGPFAKTDDLLNIKIIDHNTLRKIEPYLALR